MPKSRLAPPFDQLEADLIETLIAGHQEFRSDLAYPQSHSDMQGAVRGLLRMYEVKRRPQAILLPYPCGACEGLGHFRRSETEKETCIQCKGKGRIPEKGITA